MRVRRGAAAYDVPIRLDLGCEKEPEEGRPVGGEGEAGGTKPEGPGGGR